MLYINIRYCKRDQITKYECRFFVDSDLQSEAEGHTDTRTHRTPGGERAAGSPWDLSCPRAPSASSATSATSAWAGRARAAAPARRTPRARAPTRPTGVRASKSALSSGDGVMALPVVYNSTVSGSGVFSHY